jgi:hypothetical protein
LSVLETSYLVMRLPRYHRNFGKRLVKQHFNAGQGAELFFWRDNVGLEVDVVFETPQGLQAIEIKSGSTFASDWPQAVSKWAGLADTPTLPPQIIFGGSGHYARQGCDVLWWREFAQRISTVMNPPV